MNRSGRADSKPINLALQGGGAHGAFTWGVLDRIMEDDRLHIEAISGTSAGAMNAVVVADGIMRNGYEGARQGLHNFWKKVSDIARFSPVQRAPIDIFMGNWSLDNSPTFLAFDLVNRLTSPYELNPLNINPLQDIVQDMVDFERVRSCDEMNIFISATNVQTGRVQLFKRERLTAYMVMASACLPFIFQAVEIDGVPYWDGGYMGNPSLFPFFNGSQSDDIIIVQINPIEREGVPKTAREILDRVNDITFNSSLMKELRAIDFVCRLLEEGKLEDTRYRKMNLHIVEANEELSDLGSSSKFNAEWDFLVHLHDIGYSAAEDWLDLNFKDLGRKSTMDLRSMFQGLGDQHHG